MASRDNTIEDTSSELNRALVALAVLISISILVYVFAGSHSAATAIPTTISTIVTTVPSNFSNNSTTTIPPLPNVSNVSSITNGAQAEAAVVGIFLGSSIVGKSWTINITTALKDWSSSELSIENLSFNISKTNGGIVAYSVSRNTVSSTAYYPSSSGYSGNYSMLAGSACIYNLTISANAHPPLCYQNLTSWSNLSSIMAFFSNLSIPMTSIMNSALKSPQLDVFPAPYNASLPYTFVKYASVRNYSCALMAFSMKNFPGTIGNGYPATISLNGTTCLSTSFGFPVSTKVKVSGHGGGMNVSIDGNLSISD